MKKINDDIKIYLLVNGEKVVPEDDGYVGELLGSDEAVIGVAACMPVHAFDVDGQKNVRLRRNLAEDMGLDSSLYRIFQQRISVKWGEMTGVWHTEYPQNHLCLLEVMENGKFQTWEIGLVSQAGRFFLTVQNVYNDTCYRDESGKMACPAFEKRWPQFVDMLRGLTSDAKLPPLSEYAPKNSSNSAPGKGTGKVLWWNQAQGLGMVAVDKSVSPNGTARVHWSNLSPRTGNGFAYLDEGDLVRWQATRTPHQTKIRKTTFVCELVGVKLAE